MPAQRLERYPGGRRGDASVLDADPLPPRRLTTAYVDAHAGYAWAWYSTWCLLCRLLLGVDGAAVRGRRDEPAVDSRHQYIRPPGKSNSGWPRDCAVRWR